MSARFSLALAMLTLSWSGAHAAADYPAKPVTVVLPNPPGAIADLVARPTLEGLRAQLNQPFVMTHRPGAGGAVGTAQAAGARPDGYTLLISLPSLVEIPETQKATGEKPSFQLEQFEPIGRMTAVPQILLVRADSPWKSIHELLADARARPEKITFGSAGAYTAIHLATEMLAHAAGVRLFHVPYQGGAPAVAALLGAQVDLTNSVVQSVPLVKAGKARALAIYGEKRYPLLPEVPTLREVGYDVEAQLWVGLFALAATPPAVVQRLREALRVVVSSEAFKETLLKIGTPVSHMDGPEFKASLQAQRARLAAILSRVGPHLEKTK